MTIALDLARKINSIQYENLPEPAIYWAKVAIIDTIGSLLAGVREPCASNRGTGQRHR